MFVNCLTVYIFGGEGGGFFVIGDLFGATVWVLNGKCQTARLISLL